MNKRIRHLAEQAGMKECALGFGMPENVLWGDDQIKNFAELIVGQCASIVCLYRRDNMQDKAIADILEDAYREIKLSFGLKP